MQEAHDLTWRIIGRRLYDEGKKDSRYTCLCLLNLDRPYVFTPNGYLKGWAALGVVNERC